MYPTVRTMAVRDSVLHAGTTGGVARLLPDASAEAGTLRWGPLLRDLRNTNTRDIAVADGKPYAAAHGGLFRYLDDDGEWTRAVQGMQDESGDFHLLRALEVRGGTMYVGTGSAGVLRSVDGGVSWEPVNEGLWDPGE